MSNKTHRITLILRIIAFVVSAVSFSCFAVSQDAHARGGLETIDLGSPFVSPVTYCVEFAMVWSLVAIPIQASSPSPIHPGIHVAFDLLAWSTVLATTLVFFPMMQPYFSSDSYGCEYSRAGKLCEWTSAGVAEPVGGAFALLSSALHFSLFVWACRATDKLNKLNKHARESDKVNA